MMDENMVPMEEYNAVRHNMEHFLDTVTKYMDENKELEQQLEEANNRLRETFEELKQIRSKLMYGDELAYVVEDMVQELIWRVGHYVGEF